MGMAMKVGEFSLMARGNEILSLHFKALSHYCISYYSVWPVYEKYHSHAGIR